MTEVSGRPPGTGKLWGTQPCINSRDLKSLLSASSLQLEARATVADDVITYTIYPTRIDGRRMWDLKINVAIPEGTTFLSA